MSQITRCPGCTTMFRVTADQLALAQGWVRCGQCGEVFEARRHWVAPPQAVPEVQAVQEAPAVLASDAVPDVAFVREARRQDAWRSSRLRAWLGGLCVLLAAALLLQWFLQQKDALAAQNPRLAPWLAVLCRPLGCEVRPLRRLEALVIENASFSKTGLDAYRLGFVLRNTGSAALEIPALEVTLTDSQDQPLVRRVVLPAQFSAPAITLGAHAELADALSLRVASGEVPADLLPVAGYRILAFYP